MTHLHFSLLIACGLVASASGTGFADDQSESPRGIEYFELRDGLNNCRRRMERDKEARVAFLGGSITAGGGWRDHVIAGLKQRYPATKFEFISAGISSLGSVPHAFRLNRDVLGRGPVDLLFVEAAVNDTTNTPDPRRMLRGMEGVVRHARLDNPLIDIVHLHFVMPEHMRQYQRGMVPPSIAQHERVAAAYGNVSLNLSREVTDRIQAGEFTWEGDFKNLHPSPFGHRLYANSIERMLSAAFSGPLSDKPAPHSLPQPLDEKSYYRGRFGSLASAKHLHGFQQVAKWRPQANQRTRAGFVDVPALVGEEPGDSFEFQFEGVGVGLFITAGPDAGQIEYSIDGDEYKKIETFTRWSGGLHLPWAVILNDELDLGRHNVKVRIAGERHTKSRGSALRVFHLLLN